MDIKVDYYHGLGLLVRDFPVYQTNDDGEVYDNMGLRHPKIIVEPAREIVRPATSDLEPRLEGVDEILGELGLSPDDLGLLKDEGEVVSYTKERTFTIEDIETYALTHLMGARFGGISIVIPH